MEEIEIVMEYCDEKIIIPEGYEEKKGKKRSIVWNYFWISNDKKKTRCKLCEMVYDDSSSTGNMSSHIALVHQHQVKFFSFESFF